MYLPLCDFIIYVDLCPPLQLRYRTVPVPPQGPVLWFLYVYICLPPLHCPYTMATTIPFFISIASLFQECCISGIVYYEPFRIGLFYS